jgi:hypothetical protein
MPLNHSTLTLPETSCCVHPVHDEFGGTGLAVSRSVAANEQLLSVPLHDCVVVRDYSPPSLGYRGNHPLCIEQVRSLIRCCRLCATCVKGGSDVVRGVHKKIRLLQVLASLQSQWQLPLPKPLLDYVDSRSLDKELRLAAMLAWMKLHVAPVRTHDHWAQWFSDLPRLEDVPLLSTTSALESQILESYAPHLRARTLRAKAHRVKAWGSAVATSPHIWLALPKLAPNTTAPNSFPQGTISLVTLVLLRAHAYTCTLVCNCVVFLRLLMQFRLNDHGVRQFLPAIQNHVQAKPAIIWVETEAGTCLISDVFNENELATVSVAISAAPCKYCSLPSLTNMCPHMQASPNLTAYTMNRAGVPSLLAKRCSECFIGLA